MRDRDEDQIQEDALAGSTAPRRTITFRNNETGETLEVDDTPAARALVAQQSGMNRKARRGRDAAIQRARRKGRR